MDHRFNISLHYRLELPTTAHALEHAPAGLPAFTGPEVSMKPPLSKLQATAKPDMIGGNRWP